MSLTLQANGTGQLTFSENGFKRFALVLVRILSGHDTRDLLFGLLVA